MAIFIPRMEYIADMLFENPRMWVFYYLICFVALLWVGFLSVQGVMIFVSVFITMIVFGFSVLLCVMLVMEMREKEKQNELTQQAREIS